MDLHTFIWEHTFDVNKMSSLEMRETMMRHQDLVRYCKEHINCKYEITTLFDVRGIVIEFEDPLERDKLYEFADNYWLHLHD